MTTGLYTAAQSKQVDADTIAHGTPSLVLMKRAARAALTVLREQWPAATRITVCCGGGNNGGDGYLLAALAMEAGLSARVMAWVPLDALQGDAAVAAQYAVAAAVPIQTGTQDGAVSIDLDADVVVDALLGTGASGAPRGVLANAIALINHAGVPVLSLDVPSGLCADTGRVDGEVVNADATVTFIVRKRGLYTAQGPDVCGRLVHAALGVTPTPTVTAAAVDCLSLSPLLSACLPPRRATAHKGQCGHVLVVGGDEGMGGAVLLAAEAAARVGAGLVSVATQPLHVAAVLARRPEIMVHGVTSGQGLLPLLQKPDVLVVGPGLGSSAWSEQLLQQATLSGLPLVLDADGLNLLAAGRVVRQRQRPDWILTPHPGEAARLLGTDTATIQRDRFAAVQALQTQFGGTVILKGPGTLVCDAAGAVSLCPAVNPAMASGGMGDVLAGLLGGLLAQGIAAGAAARLAVCLHAALAERAAEGRTRGVLASDLLTPLSALINGAQ